MTQAFNFVAQENQDLISSLLYRTPSGMGEFIQGVGVY